MIHTRAWYTLLLMPVLVLLMAARQMPLKDPDPVAVPPGMAIETVGKAIKAALVGRGWIISEEQSGRVVSTLHLREHVAKVAVTYDTQSVQLRYVDSAELMYAEKKGVRLIHRNYLSWIQNLTNDMARNLQLMAP